MTEEILDFDEIKNEALQLGIEFRPNISAAKLQERIDAKYKELEQEDSSPTISVKDSESEGKSDTSPENRMRALGLAMRKKANELFIVTISDNDTRINSESDSCVTNCSNSLFDLGTRIIPTNEKVEVRRGHLEALRAVRIPHHMPDPNDHTVRVTTFRNRYSFQFHGTSPSDW